MLKHKSTKTQPHANGHNEAKAATAKPKSNGHAHRSATTLRSSKTPAHLDEQKTEKFRGILEEFNFGTSRGESKASCSTLMDRLCK